MDELPVCDTRSDYECDHVAEFKITAEGYPEPMFKGVCRTHLGTILGVDATFPGSTRRWIVEAL